MYALPLLVFGLDYFMAILFGIVLLLSGGLVHGIAIRRVNERQTIHRLIVLRKAYNQNQEDLSRNRDELRRVYEVLEQFESRSNDSKTTEDLQEVAYEVKFLHGLFKQLYSSG